jgi:hypothetical protein
LFTLGTYNETWVSGLDLLSILSQLWNEIVNADQPNSWHDTAMTLYRSGATDAFQIFN